MRLFALGTAPLLAVLLSACPGPPAVDPQSTQTDAGGADAGGGDAGDGGSVDAFIAAADAICLDAEREIDDIIVEFGPVVTPQDDAALGAQIIPVRRAELDALAELEVPEDVSEGFADYLDGRRTALETSEERQAAGEEGNEEYLELIDRSLRERREANEIGADIGLLTCAQRLPEDEAAELERITERFFTSADPSICTEHLTPELLEQVGGVEQCEEDQAETADSVDVTVLLGVSGLHATVRAVPDGGPSDDVPLEIDFVFRDGAWRIHGIFAAL